MKKLIFSFLFFALAIFAKGQDTIQNKGIIKVRKQADTVCLSIPYHPEKKWLAGEISLRQFNEALFFDSSDTTDLRTRIVSFDVIVQYKRQDLLVEKCTDYCISEKAKKWLARLDKGDFIAFDNIKIKNYSNKIITLPRIVFKVQ